MAKESKYSRLNAEAIRWIHAKTESWDGIDSLPYTRAFESTHADFCHDFFAVSLNTFWGFFIYVRKMPKEKKRKYGMTPASERKKHQRYVNPIPSESAPRKTRKRKA